MKAQKLTAPAEIDAEFPQHREELARRHRAVIAQRAVEHPKMDDEATRVKVAENMHGLVQEAKAKGVDMRKVYKAALRLKHESLTAAPTKRQWYYTLDPKRQNDETVAKLRKKTKYYVDIAREIANQLAAEVGSDENYFLPQLFRETHYADEPSDVERRNAPTHVVRLQDDLREMISSVATAHDLKNYFSRLHKEPVPIYRLDPEKYWIEFTGGRSYPFSVFLKGGSGGYGLAYAAEIGGLPSVKLYSEPFASDIPVRVRISMGPIAKSGVRFPSMPDQIRWTRPVKGIVTLWRDVRLSVCPVPRWPLPQPVFEVRQAVVLETASTEFDLREMTLSVEFGNEFPIVRGKSLFLGRIEDARPPLAGLAGFNGLLDGFDLLTNPNSSWNENTLETHNFWFFNLNRSSCRRYLERKKAPETRLAEHLPNTITKQTRFPENQIGAHIEQSLYDPPDRDLCALLVADVERRKKALDEYCQERDAESEARRAAARRRWKSKVG